MLAQRLQGSPKTRNFGISNQGIGGNHLLKDGLGPNVLARFDRDVLAPEGVQWVIAFEGVNDLGGLARNGEVSPAEHAAWCSEFLLRITKSSSVRMGTACASTEPQLHRMLGQTTIIPAL